mmetsp:Transcript_36673/g.98275  ORF Transcript_36673/g.98275 Transcript_36673/m.98275 type:complete len:229 (-) Transcript_36673:115-801(-)
MLKMPSGLRLSIRVRQSWLSGKSLNDHWMPSRSYSACSILNTNELNCCWSFSFVKLMQSCSNELRLKHSKPKMSSTEMEASTSFSSHTRFSLIFITIQSNMREYRILHRASRASAACCGRNILVIVSNRVTMVLVVIAVTRLSWSTAQSVQKASAFGMLSAVTSEPSPSSVSFEPIVTCPSCNSAAEIERISSASSAVKLRVTMAARILLNSSWSSISRRSKMPPWLQ